MHRGLFRLGQAAATQKKQSSSLVGQSKQPCLKILKEKLLKKYKEEKQKIEKDYLNTVKAINKTTSKHQEILLYNARRKKEQTIQKINTDHDEAMANLLEKLGQKATLNSCSGC
jgi:hypothetical protein